MKKTLIVTALLTSVCFKTNAQTITWVDTGSATAWYTPANWSPSTSSSAWTTANIAQFANAGTATTAGINIATSPLSIGAIEVTSVRTRALTIGNSSSTAGNLTLNGATVNSVANVILRNNSATVLTVQNSETSTTRTMGVLLGNATNNVVNIDGAGDIAISSIISGVSRSLSLNGSSTGVLALSGANTFTGGLTVNSGTLQIGRSSVITAGVVTSGPVGTGTLTLANGATIRTSSTSTRYLENNLILGGNVTFGSTGSGNLVFDSDNGTTATLLTTPATVTLASNTQMTTNVVTYFDNVISGAFNISKTGASNLRLVAANTFSGTFSADAGITYLDLNKALGGVSSVSLSGTSKLLINLGISDGLNDTAAVSMTGTAQIDAKGSTETISALTGVAGTTVIIGDYTSGATPPVVYSGNFTVGDSSSTTFAGVISGSRTTITDLIFTKKGSGTLTLTADNTYVGATTISGGKLALNATTGVALSGTTGVTVSTGGTLLLGKSDQVNNAATVTLSGGKIDTAGFSEGTATTAGLGALTLSESSVIDLGAVASIVSFSASNLATWDLTKTLSIWNWTGNVSGSGTDQLYFGTTNSGLTNDQLARISFYSGAGTGAIGVGSQILSTGEIVPVPEPATWLGAGLLTSLAAWSLRKRMRASELIPCPQA